jgi:hypothetical protein
MPKIILFSAIVLLSRISGEEALKEKKLALDKWIELIM